MKLRYIGLDMRTTARDGKYESHFDYHTYFIWHCLSKEVRKLKFETDGTFNAIIIQVGAESPSVKIEGESLFVKLPFDFDFYDNANQAQKYQYYFELLHKGLQIASMHKNIPLEEIYNFIPKLVENNFIYSWDFKNLRVPEYNLKVKFTCHLSTDDFILKLTALRNKELEPVCEGIVIRTMPDYIFFSYISKNIQVKNDRICISDRFHEMLTIRLKELIKGNLIIDYSESPYPEDQQLTKYFNNRQASLRYDNYDFISARQE